MVNINSNEPLFYSYRILVNKWSGSCNDINNPYAKLCVPDIVKDMTIKLLNLLSNETGYMSLQETYACKFRLDAKNRLIKVSVMMDLFGILLDVNVINHVMLVNT